MEGSGISIITTYLLQPSHKVPFLISAASRDVFSQHSSIFFTQPLILFKIITSLKFNLLPQ